MTDIDYPKKLKRTDRRNGEEKILDGDMDIRRAVGVLADSYGIDHGEVIKALAEGPLRSLSFYYELA